MNSLALGLAKNKLIAAIRANDKLQVADNYIDAENAWSDFIMAASTVYSKLEQGSKNHPKSNSWFGRIKHQRRKDDLLRYLHFARNSDEHVVEFITERYIPKAGGSKEPFFLRPEEAFGKEVPLNFQVKNKNGDHLPPVTITGMIDGPNIRLRTVTDDRFRDKCDPPRIHLGIEIEKPTPQKTAALAVQYLVSIVTEAESYVIDAQSP